MILFICLLFVIFFIIFFTISCVTYENSHLRISIIFGVFAIVIFIFGLFHGFINYPPTEGTQQGFITAVDLEGVYFRRYEIYVKSNGYTEQGDETKYLIYENENELAEQLKDYIGKEVKLHYAHKGGYIGWRSCGTYHIVSVELVEE